MIATTAMQAIGAISQANSKASELRRQAQVADYNAAVSKQQAEQALQVSTAQQLDQNRKARQVLGTQRAAAAQAGVGFTGTTGDILERSETLAELDQLNTAYEGALKARGYTMQSELDAYQGRAYRASAASTVRQGFLSAAGAVASSAFKWSKMTDGPKTTVGSTFSLHPGGSGVGLRIGGGGVGLRPGGGVGLRVG